jgi:hypothetical protein
MRSLSTILNSPELQREKQKDYRNVVILQVTLIVLSLTLYAPMLEDPASSVSKVLVTIFSVFGVLYAFMLWDLLRNFTTSKVLVTTILFTLVAISIFGIMIEFPYYQLIEIENRRVSLLIIHGLLFPIEVIIISFAIRDIFMSQYFTTDKLWGSACIFLLIGISFGSLYDIICILVPGSLGADIALGIPNYSECVAYSFHVLGGIDSDYPEANKLIKNLSVMEAVWGNLFTVLIIGKLMILPKAPENSKS